MQKGDKNMADGKVTAFMYRLVKIVLTIMVGAFIGAFAMNVSTVNAAESELVIIEDEQVALDDGEAQVAEQADGASSVAFLIMGGMLLIVIAVVITVVATFVVTAPIADEI